MALVLAILAIALILFGQSAAITKPNPSFMEYVPTPEDLADMSDSNTKKAYELFRKLHQEHTELAEELGRIPEFSDNDILDQDLRALANMTDYFHIIDSKYPDRFDRAFKEILDAGIKEKRKYCSPLRFLFWLAEEGKFDEESILYSNNPLKYFSLTSLISSGVTNFSEKMDEFDEVIEALNSPELVGYWTFHNVKYVENLRAMLSPETVIRRKIGDCDDLATLAAYCLDRSGYEAQVVTFGWTWKEVRRRHTIATIRKEDGIYIVMDFWQRYRVRINGPFEDYYGAVTAVVGPRRSLDPASVVVQTCTQRITQFRNGRKLL